MKSTKSMTIPQESGTTSSSYDIDNLQTSASLSLAYFDILGN